MEFNTKLIHSGSFEDQFGSATVPIYQTSTFKFKNAQHGADCFSGESDGYIYTRIANPTIKALEQNIAELENGFGGIATSSGNDSHLQVLYGITRAGSQIISTESYMVGERCFGHDFSRSWCRATFCKNFKFR